MCTRFRGLRFRVTTRVSARVCLCSHFLLFSIVYVILLLILKYVLDIGGIHKGCLHLGGGRRLAEMRTKVDGGGV